MHGVRRTKPSPEAVQAARRAKEASKIAEYRALEGEVLERKKRADYTPESLSLTTQLLWLNPEYYSIWNYRRLILQLGIFPSLPSPEHQQPLLLEDLQLTIAALKAHPKVYWIWNHRKWTLETLAGTFGVGKEDGRRWEWGKEIRIVEGLLEKDSRNFHAWNYRRYLLSSLSSPSPNPPPFPLALTPAQLSAERAYTTCKIESSFSNFSAWHQRTKVLEREWARLGAEQRRAERDEEFEFVKQALYTDPSDQSGWLYHRWLVSLPDFGDRESLLRRELLVIAELAELEPDSKWPLDSLATYKHLLLSLLPPSSPERTQLLQECKEHLEKLAEIDPDRRGRYRELAGRLG